jgi:ATP-binding cassette, subfamily B, bacterial
VTKNRFPFFHQRESADCGPSCLRMISNYYGCDYSSEMLRKHSFISREGVSMPGISDAAEHIGLKTLGAMVSFDQLVNEAISVKMVVVNSLERLPCAILTFQ